MAYNSSCKSKQTFCALNHETVKDIDSLKFSYNGCITANEVIDDDTWNEMINAIIKVYNYGVRGTRNPNTPLSLTPDADITNNYTTQGNENKPSKRISTEKKNTKYESSGDQISRVEYNKILKAVGLTSLPNNTNSQHAENPNKIYGNYFAEVMTALNNLKLNQTRCNNCNTGCNTNKCLVSSQCCDNQCCTNCCTDCCTNSGPTCSYCNSCQYSQNPECSNCQWQESSALEFKENIHSFNLSGIDLINTIKIVDFNYKNDNEKNYKVGFIADNTNEIFSTKNHNVMDMYNCIGVLLKAVQELSNDNKLLKFKIEEIEKRTDT